MFWCVKFWWFFWDFFFTEFCLMALVGRICVCFSVWGLDWCSWWGFCYFEAVCLLGAWRMNFFFWFWIWEITHLAKIFFHFRANFIKKFLLIEISRFFTSQSNFLSSKTVGKGHNVSIELQNVLQNTFEQS